jgi:hypothetical protein
MQYFEASDGKPERIGKVIGAENLNPHVMVMKSTKDHV